MWAVANGYQMSSFSPREQKRGGDRLPPQAEIRHPEYASVALFVGSALFLILPTDLLCGGVVGIMCSEPAGKPVAVPGLENVPLLKACLVIVYHLEPSCADLLPQSIVGEVFIIASSQWGGGRRMRCC